MVTELDKKVWEAMELRKQARKLEARGKHREAKQLVQKSKVMKSDAISEMRREIEKSVVDDKTVPAV